MLKENKIWIWVMILVFIVWTHSNVGAISDSVSINVVETQRLDMIFIPLDDPSNLNSNINEFVEFVNHAYPIADDGLVSRIGPSRSTGILEKADTGFLLFNIARFSYISNTKSRVVGVLPDYWYDVYEDNAYTLGESYRPPLGILLRSSLVEAVGNRNLVAHEIGHTFGLCDEYDFSEWDKQNSVPFVSCPNGDSDNDNQLDLNCFSGGCPTSVIGKLVPWSDTNDSVDMTNFMGNNLQDETWISKESYGYLLNKFKATTRNITPNTIMVDGMINKSSNTVELYTSYILNNAEVTLQEDIASGNYSIEIRNIDNIVTSNISFNPSFSKVSLNGSAVETNISYFVMVMNFSSNDQIIRAKENNITKDEVNRTPNTPSISITSNLSNKLFSNEIFNISWGSSDLDGDSLVYAVLFSEDNGSNYTTLEIDYNQTILTLNSSNLPNCDSCRIKVLSTDGINTNLSVSDVFKIINNLNDTTKFYIKNNLSENVAWMGDKGNIVLKGECFNITNLNLTGLNETTAGADAFLVRNSTGNIMSFIDTEGNLVISKGSCENSVQATCNPSVPAFIIQDSSDVNVAYLNNEGGLCLTGGLYENANKDLLNA